MIFQGRVEQAPGDWMASDLENGLGEIRKNLSNRKCGEKKKVKHLGDKELWIDLQL